MCLKMSGFNPRAHAGRDQSSRPGYCHRWFQSTRPRGARLAELAVAMRSAVSIHAPTRGATFPSIFKNPLTPFQSTRPRGARPGLPVPLTPFQVSIHAPTRGATYSQRTGIRSDGFNPRAHAGRDSCL